MQGPLTITSLSQGKLHDAPESEEDYWQRHLDKPQAEGQPFGQSLKIEWPRWSLRRWVDRS